MQYRSCHRLSAKEEFRELIRHFTIKQCRYMYKSQKQSAETTIIWWEHDDEMWKVLHRKILDNVSF